MQAYTHKRGRTGKAKKQTTFPEAFSIGREGAEFQPSTFGEHPKSAMSTWVPGKTSGMSGPTPGVVKKSDVTSKKGKSKGGKSTPTEPFGS